MMMTMMAASPPPPQTFSDLRTKTTTHSIVAAAANRRSSTITSSQSASPHTHTPLLHQSLVELSRHFIAEFFKILSMLTVAGRRSAEAYTVEDDDDDDDERRLRRRGRNLNPNELMLEPFPERGGRKMRLKGSKGRQRTVEKEEPKQNRTTHKMLKVIGGKAKRKKLLSPTDMDVRPMMEVVKGATFDILQAAGGCHAYLRPGRWLDLYSGTGSVGIEALSRGCSEVHFVEIDPWVVSNVLRPNLEWTGFLDASVIHTIPVERFMEQAEHNTGKSEPFDYISVTPPYTQVDYKVLMDQFSTSPLIGEDTFMVVEYPIGMTLLDSCGILIKIVDRRFGRTNLAIYGPVWAERRKK